MNKIRAIKITFVEASSCDDRDPVEMVFERIFEQAKNNILEKRRLKNTIDQQRTKEYDDLYGESGRVLNN